MINDKQRIYDGWETLAAGMDAGRRPSLIDPNQTARSENVVYRGGVPKSRPGINQLTLAFQEELYYAPSGLAVGPPIITDGEMINVSSHANLFSQTAQFVAGDVGRVVINVHLAPGTTITSRNSNSWVILSNPTLLDGVTDQTVSFVGRNTPRTFIGSINSTAVISTPANFSNADIGQPLTGPTIPDGTYIVSVTNPSNAVMSYTAPIPVAGIEMALPYRPLYQSSSDTFRQAPFQCASYYAPPNKKESIMVTIGGRLFQITPEETTAEVREIQLDYRNRATIQENYMVQADRFHITQDGESRPIIFDGVAAHRAADDEVVVGTIMTYGIGRLVVVRGRDIFFGDLFGSHAGDPSDSVIKFTETNFLSEGFPAAIPFADGDVTGAAFYPQQDTATGQGQLIVFTDAGAVTFNVALERSEWKKSAFQQIALVNSTARGDKAIVGINGDLWIRSDEGWRAYRQARAQINGWSQLPQSTEVRVWLDNDTQAFLRYGSAVHFDNRLITTVNPVPNQGRVYHDALLVLDFEVLSSFGQSTKPAWDGRWKKMRTLQLVSGIFQRRDRCFALALDENDETVLYEITSNGKRDFDGPVESAVEFRSFNFSSPFNEKSLYGADIWVEEVTEPVTMDLSFRPDSSQEYLPWKTFDPVTPPGDCNAITCGMCPTIGEGFAPRQRAPKPQNDCDEQTLRLIRRGFEFQPKLEWTGHATIRKLRLSAVQEEEDPKATC